MTSLLLAVPEDHVDLRDHVVAMVQESPDLILEAEAGAAIEVVRALEAAQEPVDVVILHEHLEGTDVLDFAQELNRRFPDVPLLLLVDRESPEQFRDAMFAGFRGVISGQMALDDFDRTVRNAGEWSASVRGRTTASTTGTRRRRNAQVLAVAGGKGGVGCTTVATSLALSLAEDGQRSVCLVDLDLQAGDVRSYLSTVHERSIHGLVAIASELTDQAIERVLFRHASGLRVLLPPVEGELSEDVDGVVARQVLGALRSRFDVVIVDVGSHMGDASVAAVEMADAVALVTTPDLPALRGANRLLAMWKRLSIRSDDVLVCANRVSRDNEIQPDVLARLLNGPLATHHLPACFRALEGPVNAGDLQSAEEVWHRAVEGLRRDLEAAVGERDAAIRTAAEQAGQATVEFVAALPLLVLGLLLVAQGAVHGWAMMQVQDAAREGARQLEVSTGTDTDGDGVFDDVGAAAIGRLPQPYRPRARVQQSGRTVRVTVDVPSVLPGIPSLAATTGSAGAAT